MRSMTARQRRRNDFILGVLSVVFFTMALITMANSAGAQISDPIILTPDSVTGEYTAKLNSNTDDPRLVEVCLFRIDHFHPTPETPIACTPRATGRAPLAGEESPSGNGLVYFIPFASALIPGQDQLIVARNRADVGGGTIIESPNSDNSVLLPQPLVSPMFLIEAPPAGTSS